MPREAGARPIGGTAAVPDGGAVGVRQASVHPDDTRQAEARIGAVEAVGACALASDALRVVDRRLARGAGGAGGVQDVAHADVASLVRVEGGKTDADAATAADAVGESHPTFRVRTAFERIYLRYKKYKNKDINAMIEALWSFSHFHVARL